MKNGPLHIFDRSDDSSAPEPRPASWYTPGTSDGLGDRLLMFDNSTASSLELLRFKAEFSDQPAFEAALRRRFDQFERFRHPQVAVVRAVKWLGDGEGLALVSEHVAGRRLSELVGEASGPMLAMELVRQLAPVLAELEAYAGPGGHGALTANRIIVAPDGQLVIVEHVIGPAIASVGLSVQRRRSALGLAVGDADAGLGIDGRADVVQLALAALSVVLGRPVDAADYPAGIQRLLVEAGAASRPHHPMRPSLREWLERALADGDATFHTASDASVAWTELVDADAERPPRPRRLAFPRPAVARLPSPSEAHGPAAEPAKKARPQPALAPLVPQRLALPSRRRGLSARTLRGLRWVVATVAVVAIGEGVVIVRLMRAPRAAVPAATAAWPATAVKPDAGRPDGAPVPRPPDSSTTRPDPPAAKAEAKTAADLVGGLSVVAPFELQVFEGSKLVGATAGAIALSAGSHALDFVSDLVGYRTHETVRVHGGQTTRVTITPPKGRISVNAAPWAEVLIDGVSVGETPLANLPVALGTHEITFRHPQLGEQRYTAIVKVDAVTRVTAKFQR